jgi:hypothetical protein
VVDPNWLKEVEGKDGGKQAIASPFLACTWTASF